jgi:hypothetical protein
MSQTYQVRPSELLGLTNKLHSYFLDRAVFRFGGAIDEDLEIATRNVKTDSQRAQKQQMVLRRWDVIEEGTKGRFRDPAAGR